MNIFNIKSILLLLSVFLLQVYLNQSKKSDDQSIETCDKDDKVCLDAQKVKPNKNPENEQVKVDESDKTKEEDKPKTKTESSTKTKSKTKSKKRVKDEPVKEKETPSMFRTILLSIFEWLRKITMSFPAFNMVVEMAFGYLVLNNWV